MAKKSFISHLVGEPAPKLHFKFLDKAREKKDETFGRINESLSAHGKRTLLYSMIALTGIILVISLITFVIKMQEPVDLQEGLRELIALPDSLIRK